MPLAKQIVFDIRYRANTRMEIVKRCQVNALKPRESGNGVILAITSFDLNRNFTIDVSDIEWVRIEGKIHRLRSPHAQHYQRQQELKSLLLKRQTELDDPNLIPGKTGGNLFVRTIRYILGFITGIIGFALFSLPGIAFLALVAGAVYAMVKMAHVIH